MLNNLLDFRRTIEVKNASQFYLDDILTNDDYKIMMQRKRVVVLNKTECGNGGTSGIVKYIKSTECIRGALILVPNRSIVISKEDTYKDDSDICCVYGGKDEIDLTARIVIATYDQFERLLNTLDSIGSIGNVNNCKFWEGRVIVVDEYHKLIDESKFRPVMVGMTDLIIKTREPVVLMSATPHDAYIETLSDVLYEKKDIIPLNISYKMTDTGLVEPDDDKREAIEKTKMHQKIVERLKNASRRMTKSMSIYDIAPYELTAFCKWLISSGKKVCVFYNNVSKVSQIMKKVGTEECEILCSNDEKQKEKCGKYYSDKYNKEKRVHFMTSAYFTGHDIDEEIDACYIIGSRRSACTAISMRDIKQIIGRFREYCGWSWNGINMMYLNEGICDEEYKTLDRQLSETEFWMKKCGSDWVNNPEAIKMKLNNLKYHDIRQQFEYWSTPEKLIKRLRAEGYEVFTAEKDGKRVDKPKALIELPEYTVESSLSYRAAFIKVANGETVSWEEYRDVNKITEYISRYGITRNRRGNVIVPPREKVFAYLKMDNVFDEFRGDFEVLSPDDRYVAVGFEDCAIYKAKALLYTLKYIQEFYPRLVEGELDYGLLPIKFREVFGAVMYCEKEGRTKGSDMWCIMGSYLFDKFNEMTTTDNNLPPDTFFGVVPLYSTTTRKSVVSGKNEVKLSYMTGLKYEKSDKSGKQKGRCMARTIDYAEIQDVLNPLTGIYIYDWVNQDKKTRIYKMKMDLEGNNGLDKLKELIASWRERVDAGEELSPVEAKIYKKVSVKTDYELKIWYHFIKDKQEKWKELKNYGQLKISDLYLDDDKEYRHTKGEMNKVGCLIDDIDSGLRFSEFKEIYKQYKWYAYPTISNTDPNDWHKFRVIVPLSNTLTIDGENNVKVLKALRNMFCPYEDPCHGLTSYINLNDFEHMYVNDGEVYDVNQKTVDLLQHLVSVSNTYTTTTIEKEDIPLVSSCSNSSALINGTIKMFNKCVENWNTTIYNRLWKLITIDGFTRKEIDEIKAGLTNPDFADYMEVVINAHSEWNL